MERPSRSAPRSRAQWRSTSGRARPPRSRAARAAATSRLAFPLNPPASAGTGRCDRSRSSRTAGGAAWRATSRARGASVAGSGSRASQRSARRASVCGVSKCARRCGAPRPESPPRRARGRRRRRGSRRRHTLYRRGRANARRGRSACRRSARGSPAGSHRSTAIRRRRSRRSSGPNCRPQSCRRGCASQRCGSPFAA